MKFSKNAWHARLYSLTYGTDASLPTNLCPYFWKLVLAGVVFAPLSLYYIPLFLILLALYYIGDNKDIVKYARGEGYLSSNIVFGIIATVALIVVYSMIACWFYPFGSSRDVAIIGHALWILLFLGGIIYLLIWLRDKYRSKRVKEPSPNIITEFIKAKLQKYCPQIEWE